MVRGGVILTALFSIRSQKRIKPLFLAISCKESLFNIKDNNQWKDCFEPFFNYELNIFNDFCRD